MTNEMFIGGLMILTVAAVVVFAMTSSNSAENGLLGWLRSAKKDGSSGKRKDCI